MSKRLFVDFMSSNEPVDDVVSNALLTQLMVTITQIGIRVDNPNDITENNKEKETNVNKESKNKQH